MTKSEAFCVALMCFSFGMMFERILLELGIATL